MKIAVIGSGAWATALAHAFSTNSHQVVLVGRDEKSYDSVRNVNLKYFPDFVLSPFVSFSTKLDSSLRDADAILFCVPSKAYREKAREVALLLDHPVTILSAAKGLDPESFRPLSFLLEEELPKRYVKGIVSLIGPSFASEVMEDKITTICAVGRDEAINREIQKAFSTPCFRIYTNQDEIGAQIGAALKNVIAIAGGCISGLKEGENAKAGLVTRGLAEVIRFGVALGGKAETFFGLTGIGDLLLTCSSMKSRNYSLGYQIGLEDDASKVLSRNEATVEGVIACKYAYLLSKKMDIDMPIVHSVYQVLYEGGRPSLVLKETMARSLKAENEKSPISSK